MRKHSTAQHSTAQHSTAQHSTAQHSSLTKAFLSVYKTLDTRGGLFCLWRVFFYATRKVAA